MNKSIRRGVFETNSSSTHAICIKPKPRNLEPAPYSTSLLALSTRKEFTDAFILDEASVLYGKIDKINFCLLIIKTHKNKNIREKYLSMLKEVLKKGKITLISSYADRIDNPPYWPPYDDTIEKAIFGSIDSLDDFIFGPDSCIILGRDDSEEYSYIVEKYGAVR